MRSALQRACQNNGKSFSGISSVFEVVIGHFPCGGTVLTNHQWLAGFLITIRHPVMFFAFAINAARTRQKLDSAARHGFTAFLASLPSGLSVLRQVRRRIPMSWPLSPAQSGQASDPLKSARCTLSNPHSGHSK
jgi:hypothetical protein